MKKYLMPIALIILAGTIFALGFFAKPITQHFYQNKVLVKVNREVITEQDLKREIDFLRVSDSTPISNITREDVLDRMINDLLILGEAKKLELEITEDTIESYINKFWKGYSEENKRKILKANNLTMDEWTDLIKKRMLIEYTITRAVEDQVHVGANEIEEYYWTHLLEFYRPVRVRARQIVVETEEQAEVLRKKLEEGGDFKSLAEQYSRGPEKDHGGDLGWVTSDDLPKAFTDIIFKMKTKKISQPVATAYGYHLFYVDQREDGGKIALKEAKSSINDKLKLIKTDRVFQAWLEEIRAQAEIRFIR